MCLIVVSSWNTALWSVSRQEVYGFSVLLTYYWSWFSATPKMILKNKDMVPTIIVSFVGVYMTKIAKFCSNWYIFNLTLVTMVPCRYNLGLTGVNRCLMELKWYILSVNSWGNKQRLIQSYFSRTLKGLITIKCLRMCWSTSYIAVKHWCKFSCQNL